MENISQRDLEFLKKRGENYSRAKLWYGLIVVLGLTGLVCGILGLLRERAIDFSFSGFFFMSAAYLRRDIFTNRRFLEIVAKLRSRNGSENS